VRSLSCWVPGAAFLTLFALSASRERTCSSRSSAEPVICCSAKRSKEARFAMARDPLRCARDKEGRMGLAFCENTEVFEDVLPSAGDQQSPDQLTVDDATTFSPSR